MLQLHRAQANIHHNTLISLPIPHNNGQHIKVVWYQKIQKGIATI